MGQVTPDRGDRCGRESERLVLVDFVVSARTLMRADRLFTHGVAFDYPPRSAHSWAPSPHLS